MESLDRIAENRLCQGRQEWKESTDGPDGIVDYYAAHGMAFIHDYARAKENKDYPERLKVNFECILMDATKSRLHLNVNRHTCSSEGSFWWLSYQVDFTPGQPPNISFLGQIERGYWFKISENNDGHLNEARAKAYLEYCHVRIIEEKIKPYCEKILREELANWESVPPDPWPQHAGEYFLNSLINNLLYNLPQSNGHHLEYQFQKKFPGAGIQEITGKIGILYPICRISVQSYSLRPNGINVVLRGEFMFAVDIYIGSELFWWGAARLKIKHCEIDFDASGVRHMSYQCVLPIGECKPTREIEIEGSRELNEHKMTSDDHPYSDYMRLLFDAWKDKYNEIRAQFERTYNGAFLQLEENSNIPKFITYNLIGSLEDPIEIIKPQKIVGGMLRKSFAPK